MSASFACFREMFLTNIEGVKLLFSCHGVNLNDEGPRHFITRIHLIGQL